MTPPATPGRDTHRRFPAEIISHAVWPYFRFCLSYRDIEVLPPTHPPAGAAPARF
jgi:transposase-like protein